MTDRSDQCSSLLHLQRDVENLNPSILSALLNGGRALNNLSSQQLLQTGFFPAHVSGGSSLFSTSTVMSNPELLAALSRNVRSPFHTDPLAALSLARAQQQVSLNLSSMAASASNRRGGGLLEALKFDVSSSVQNEVSVSEAYQRGREEAFLSLLRSGAVRQPTCVDPVPSSPVAPSLATSTNVALGTVADLVSPKDSNTRALETLGTDARRKTNAPYFDASSLDDPDEGTLSNRRTRGGVTEPFPEKLHRMLRETLEIGKTDIISFYPHGRAFGIHHPERFCREIMPKYFKQSRLSSFQRQLNLYGFTRISSGPDCGGYYHELFLKGRPALSIHMRRVGVAQGTSTTKGCPRVSNAVVPTGATPDFYSMAPVKERDLPRNCN
jgi:hypothetical protein